MPGIIQSSINAILKSAASIGKGDRKHAGQAGEKPSSQAQAEKMGLNSVPSSSKVAEAISKYSLQDSRDSKRINREGLAAKRQALQSRKGKMAKAGKETK